MFVSVFKDVCVSVSKGVRLGLCHKARHRERERTEKRERTQGEPEAIET